MPRMIASRTALSSRLGDSEFSVISALDGRIAVRTSMPGMSLTDANRSFDATPVASISPALKALMDAWESM